MTVAEMTALYTHVMRHGQGLSPKKKYTVRVWDGMDGCWCDVIANVTLGVALKTWCEKTKNGTEKIAYSEIDYYAIFPANIQMLYSGDFTMRGDDQ